MKRRKNQILKMTGDLLFARIYYRESHKIEGKKAYNKEIYCRLAKLRERLDSWTTFGQLKIRY